MTIEELPDFAAVRQLADALWRSRASIMVGAGFSRSAGRVADNSPPPPLWKDLAEAMSKQLYEKEPSWAPSAPLRLADEFRCFFGQAALDDLIRAQVPDPLWTPSDEHKALLALPWSDVLTTNYDTLLERAALEVNGLNYEIVRIASDFAHARAPRIVKLHGTIGVSQHFTITEEDYRRYPAEHAAFVNFARQSFLENELCLLGFSGDDANFLQWAGWVRDHLGSSSRRIFLVGVLSLSASKRKYLEDKNIAPIDLAPLVYTIERDKKDALASALFIKHLKSAEPAPEQDWMPQNVSLHGGTADDHKRRYADPTYAAELFHEDLRVWKHDRETYPGWLICPANVRSRMRPITHRAPWPNAKTLSGLQFEERARVLYEVMWRTKTAFGLVDAGLIQLFADVADPDVLCGLTKSEQLEMASTLLTWHRDSADDAMFRRFEAVLVKHGGDNGDVQACIAYQRALRARDRRDLAEAETYLPKIVGRDPVWALRRAALLCDLGEDEQAQSVITAALEDLRGRQRQARGSLWVASRRAWAEMFARAIEQSSFRETERWSQIFRELKCDPWETLEAVKEHIAKVRKEEEEASLAVQPLFPAGRYKDAKRNIQLAGPGTTPAWEFQCLVEDAGIPVRLGYVSILGDMAGELMALSSAKSLDDWFQLIKFAAKTDSAGFEQSFSRVKLAGISSEYRDAINMALKREIGYVIAKLPKKSKDRTSAFDRLRTLFEILARFGTLLPSDEAEKAHKFALELGRDPQLRFQWIFKSLGRLIAFSFEAIEPERRTDYVLDALNFPTVEEAGIAAEFDWPTPSTWLSEVTPKRPANDVSWDVRIAKLIKMVRFSATDRPEATFRLSYLIQHEVLNAAEREAFAEALWSQLDEGDPPLPEVRGLLISALLWLPVPAGTDVRALLSKRLFETEPRPLDQNQVFAMAMVAQPPSIAEPLLPTPDAAATLFDLLVEWRPRVFGSPLTEAFERQNEDGKAEYVGAAIAKSLVRSFPEAARTEARVDALLAFSAAVKDETAFECLPWFAIASEGRREEIIERLKRSLVGPTHREVNVGVQAVLTWDKIERGKVPEPLIERVIATLELRRWPGLTAVLLCVRKLVEDKALSEPQLGRLNGPLGDLLSETAYDRINPLSVEAVSISLVRAECVMLARALIDNSITAPNAQAWLDVASNDTLPEVRFALSRRKNN